MIEATRAADTGVSCASPRPTLQSHAAVFLFCANDPPLIRAFSDAAGFSSKIDNTFSNLKESEDIMTEMGSVSHIIAGLWKVQLSLAAAARAVVVAARDCVLSHAVN